MRWDDVTVLTLLKKTLAPSALCASQASRADQSAALTYKLPAYLCRLFSKPSLAQECARPLRIIVAFEGLPAGDRY